MAPELALAALKRAPRDASVLDPMCGSHRPAGLYSAPDGRSAEELAEVVCDHFSACLLMPRRLLRRDWSTGLRKISPLAHRYQVSKPAMDVRLHQLGLTEPYRAATPKSPDSA
jgi:IrrE N-terminal-like domain